MLSKNKIKLIKSLTDKKAREKENLFVIEGNKAVFDLLISGLKAQTLVATTKFLSSLSNKKYFVDEVLEATDEEIRKASLLKNPQQAIALFPLVRNSISPVQIKGKLSLALDTIQDPGNLGTIIRLADWFGIENLICSEETVDVFNPKVIQATMGAIARVKITYTHLPQFLSECLDLKIPIYGTFLNGEILYKKELSKEGIIVMGNEGNGISDAVADKITDRLYIPSFPPDQLTSESLNVAVATSIVCSEFRRQHFRS